jgi:arylsulfatase A-like enzyme
MTSPVQHANNLKKGGYARLFDNVLFYMAFYCGIVLLVYAGGTAGHFGISGDFQKLILETLGSSPTLVLQIVLFGLTVLALNLIPLVALLASMRVAGAFIQRLKMSRFTYFLHGVLCLWIGVLALNKLFFPKSSFALLLPIASEAQLAWLGTLALGAFVAMGVLPAAWQVLRWVANLIKKPLFRLTVGAALLVGITPPLFSHWAASPPASGQPNIIIIGLDSFSPQHMAHHPGALPRLESLLAQSTVFTQTLTPLARTFPAWTSILTAKYPVHTGARFNLTAFDQVDAGQTLPKLLKARGYTAIYAQDERKFNNIDEHFGFDATVGPQPGAAEFVLVKAADQPLVNLALLSPWTQRLFPFVALNRAAPVQYEPSEFVDAIVRSLPDSTEQPLFLAAHFCLAHHPYTWRNQKRQGGGSLSLEQNHMLALQELEIQIDRLLAALKASGRLDNAIVVLMSDHGESMGYADGLWVSRENNAAPQREASQVGAYRAFALEPGFDGHGANVLDRTANGTLLAFQAYGPLQSRFPPGEHARLASLVDIMPTLLPALDVETPSGLDGLNLMASDASMPRVVPSETGIRFNALSSLVHVDEDKLLAESKGFYRVEPDTARLIVKPERYAGLVSTKDIALHTQDWMLALLRKDGNPNFSRVALLVHKPSGAWTLGKDKALIARAPIKTLRETAKNLYAGELDDFAGTWVFN